MASDHPSSHAKPENPWLKPLALGAVATAGALILAPYVLPIFGIGSEDLTLQSVTVMHGTTEGSGLAGAINSVLRAVPAIGNELAQGGTFTAFASGVVGIGGLLLGSHIEKKGGSRKLSLGKTIRVAGLVTSALIALPSILTGIGIGMVYLAAALGDNVLASSAVGTLYNTLGTMGGAFTGPNLAAGVFAAMPHLASCGTAILPTALAMGLGLGNNPAKSQNTPHTAAPEPENNASYTDGSITARMEPTGPLVAGKPVDVRLTLTHKKTGRPITVDELATMHTQKMHLFVVDQSMKDYHHIHPAPTDKPGEYVFSFTPHTPNTYNAWTDITLMRDNNNHRLKSTLPSALKRNVRAYIGVNNQVVKDGLVLNWQPMERLRKGEANIIEVTLTDAAGKPVTDLEPVLGAYAHLVGFSADGKSLIHTHPLGAEPQGPDSHGGPRLRFQVEPDFSGPAQFYLQVKRGGKDSYAAFGQQIAPPLLNTEKMASRGSGSASHAFGHY